MNLYKVLIIEDSYDEFEDLVACLKDYPVSIFPSLKKDFDSFRKVLNRFAKYRNADDLTQIREKVRQYNPGCIFLDLGLRYDDDSDMTGKALKDLVIDPFMHDTHVCFLTLYPESQAGASSEDYYIYKETSNGLQYEIDKYFSEVLVINKVQADANVTENVVDTRTPKMLPKSSERFSIRYKERFLPWLTLLVDLLIITTFYIALTALFVLGLVGLINDIIHDLRVIEVTEHVFVAFLPFLVIFGFFVFYQQSLHQFIIRARTINVDYNQASKLMNLTKKLFVSSLVSYLFIKLIELVLGDTSKTLIEAAKQTSAEVKSQWGIPKYFNLHPELQAYFITACIVLLILYYIYLNAHREPTSVGNIT